MGARCAKTQYGKLGVLQYWPGSQRVPVQAGLKFRVRSREDHPGPEGPGVVPSRILEAGPGLGAGPGQVFRARQRGFRDGIS